MSGGKKAKQKKQCETAKKNLSPPQATARLASLSNLSSFFFSFTQSGAWSQAIGKSTTKKKTDRGRTQKNYHYMGLEYQSIRGTTYLVGVRSKVYQRLQD